MDFEPFPKIARLNRDIIITEKIDGTNAAVIIEPLDDWAGRLTDGIPVDPDVVARGGDGFRVGAQSRKRLITPEDDNFGFAAWVRDNREELFDLLGPGRHFGEWWGRGIQRGYGLNGRRFSLFRPDKLDGPVRLSPARGMVEDTTIDVVPVLHHGLFSQAAIEGCLRNLRDGGSKAQRGFMRPEGIVVYHVAARQVFKVTIENDEKPKGSNE